MARHILVHLIFIISVISLATACDTGWFGSSCQYTCHCTNNQCDVDGKCTGGSTCVRGWFGPLCQYQDLAQLNATTTSASLSDGDDTTCLSVSTFNLTWLNAYQVTWFRIVKQQSYSLQNVQLTQNETIIQRSFLTLIKVTDSVTDILCQTDVITTRVSLSFGSTLEVCSVYVSGGRNVALKQNTSQSSDYTENGVVLSSSLAVDGNTSGNFYHKTCTHTAVNQPGSWRVTFSIAKSVNRYRLYNRDNNRERLKGFVLNSYDYTASKVFEYKDISSNNNVAIYTITASLHGPVSYVNISGRNMLTVCEVEIYGDNVCTVKKYGLECTNTCNCNDTTETCVVATGGCRSGCAAGYQGEGCSQPCGEHYYGSNCDNECSKNCTNTLCNSTTGYCRQCIVGLQGNFCNQKCNATYYGQKCENKCSTNCLHQLCDNVNGFCHSCIPGKQGVFCDRECNSTYYGTNCSQRCSSNCTNSLCDNVNGACKSCVDGRQGAFCEQNCDATYYGLHCASKCSTNCTYQLCNNVNGFCLNCIAGKQGDLCNTDCDTGNYGPRCLYKCSSLCLDSKCDAVSGHCFRCKDNSTGTFCEKENANRCNDGYNTGLGHGVGIGIGVMCVIDLIVTAVACVIRRCKGDKSEESKNRNNIYDQPVELQHTNSPANSITLPEKLTRYNNTDDLMAGTNQENNSKDSTYNTLNDEFNDVSRYMSFSST